MVNLRRLISEADESGFAFRFFPSAETCQALHRDLYDIAVRLCDDYWLYQGKIYRIEIREVQQKPTGEGLHVYYADDGTSPEGVVSVEPIADGELLYAALKNELGAKQQ